MIAINYCQMILDVIGSRVGGEMGGVCGTHGREEKWIKNVVRKTLKKDLGVDGKVT
jgi:hypothetical protein